jgi:hypothetical protein
MPRLPIDVRASAIIHHGLCGSNREAGWLETWERKSEVVLFKRRRNRDDQAYRSIGWTADWE